MKRSASLPLLITTPTVWAERVLERPLLLLNDHAHLERKAAANALELLPRYPEGNSGTQWVKVLAAVAKDEAYHLATVVKIMRKRGTEMSRTHRNEYARRLHDLVRRGEGPREILDRLLVSALIEARSCERFMLLANQAQDAELAKLYRGLWASEHGHYRVFLQLAEQVVNKVETTERWQRMLQREGEILRNLPFSFSMHSYV